LQLFSSNRVERLYEGLKAALYQEGSFPFTQRLVVVPSSAMKSWLMLRLASDPIYSIAAGIEICYLDQALARISKKMGMVNPIPTHIELALLLESQIAQMIHTQHSFDESTKTLWAPLFRYLKVTDLNRYSQQRLIALSDQLAKLFMQYGRYGQPMLQSWEQSSVSKEWQEELWKSIKKAFPSLQLPDLFLSTLLDQIQFPLEHLQLHLFGMSFIPAQTYQFLTSAAEFFPIYYYLLSPCQVFWSDIYSDRERTKLQRYWRNKGISKPQQQNLEAFLRERNALLANFGRMGREMAQQIEMHSYQIEECYHLSTSALELPHYLDELPPDVFLDLQEEPFSLLSAIHSDMLLLRNVDPSEKISLPKSDLSIQLHCSYTKLREVEALYNTLLHLLTKHALDSKPLTPSDIIVMVPNLAAYEASICHVFGAKESLLDFQIMEMQFLAKSSLVKGFLHLLSISTSRWEAETILQLLEYPEFLRRHHLTYPDVLQIRTWMQCSSVNWGQDHTHRSIQLRNDYGECALVDDDPAGTWDYSISRILTALAVDSEGLDTHNLCLSPPIQAIESSQSELLSKWISILHSLKKDLVPLSSDTKISLNQWSAYLIELKDRYFQIESDQKEAKAANEALFSHLQKLANPSSFVHDRSFNFASVLFSLKKSILEDVEPYRESYLQSVRFCSLLPMRTLPAKVIALLGMDEGAFPRNEIPFSLNELPKHPNSSYCPSQTDFDRYLFLEALLSARRYLILSYLGYCFEEQREMPPSLLVQELFGYLDTGYTFEGIAPSLHCLQKHPFDAFDPSYFSEGHLFPCYSYSLYSQAKTLLQKEKDPPHRFIESFAIKLPAKTPSPTLVTLKELGAFAGNPLKVYFNDTLRIYLEKKQDHQINDYEPFELSPLDKYLLRMQALKRPVHTLLDVAIKKGTFPRGLFKQISRENITREVESMLDCLLGHGIDLETLQPMHFSEHCETPTFDKDTGWTVPPIEIELPDRSTVKIIGQLQEVTAQGLIYHQNRNLPSILKKWPHYLIFNLAIQRYQLPIQPQLLSSKSVKPFIFPIQQAEVQLKKYLPYYFLGVSTPSPLLPEWISDFLKGDANLFIKNARLSLEPESFST
ncbi:MAG: exodeoxyribonuclease V subunit gamma, partial [Parachlamydiaceae bacterium]